MYNQKLVASLKANGKVLREFKDTVYVPFGSEYSLLIKNLNTVKAIVNITIDGDNVMEGGLVIEPGQEIDLERSVKNNNLKEGNKFKFIERTNAVEQHRGVKLEDGIVRIEFQFEKPWYQPTYTPSYTWNHSHTPISSSSLLRGQTVYASGASGSTNTAFINTVTASATSASVNTSSAYYNDAGITVPGSKSDQSFQTARWFPTEEEKHVMVLKLLGSTPDNEPVAKPITVKSKPKCVTCGKQNKAHAKFCTECGTALEIFA